MTILLRPTDNGFDVLLGLDIIGIIWYGVNNQWIFHPSKLDPVTLSTYKSSKPAVASQIDKVLSTLNA